MKKEFPWAMALLLDKKKPKAKNILVGSDSVVISALQRKYGLITKFDPDSPQQFAIVDSELEVPALDHHAYGFWRNPPLSKNRELLSYIVSTMVPEYKDKDKLINSLLYDSEAVRDFDVLYWRIKAIMDSGKFYQWSKQPWENAKDWLGEVAPDLRLSWLHNDIRSYVYAQVDNKTEIKAIGISQKKLAYLKRLKLSNKKLIDTISILAKWRYQSLNGQQAVFAISQIWS